MLMMLAIPDIETLHWGILGVESLRAQGWCSGLNAIPSCS